jgi:hypothetical protein
MDQLAALLSASLSPVNLPYTVLLIAMLVYWAAVIAGALDISVFDFDMDLESDFDVGGDLDVGDMDVGDVDVGADAEVDVDADVDADAGGVDAGTGMVRSVLHYFNVGAVPVTILLSFLILSMWAVSVLANHYLHNRSLLIALLLFVPNLIVGLHVAKICSAPFKAVFKTLEQQTEHHAELLGKTCVVTTGTATASFGQAEVTTEGAPLLLNVRTGGDTLKRGEEAVITDFDAKKGTYKITKLGLEV